MSVFDNLKNASFNGTAFPIRECIVRGGIRLHQHEYPHAPASNLEKMGRRAYEIKMVGLFYDGLKRWPLLYPQALDTLRLTFDVQTTGDLVIPTIGTIRAVALDWTQVMSAKLRSGEEAQFTFVEDASDQFLTTNLVGSNSTSMTQTKANFDAAAALAAFQAPATINALQAFDSAVNSVLAIQDTADATTNLMSAKLAHLIGQAQALENCAEVQNANAWPVVNVLHDLWFAAQQQQQNLNQNVVKPLVYVTKAAMSVSQLSTAIYGDTTHAVDLLQLNPIQDAFLIPINTSIKYYPA